MSGLPFPPSENNAYVNNPRGGRFLSADAKRFQWDMEAWRRANINELKQATITMINWTSPPFLTLALGFRRDVLYTKDGRLKRVDAANYIKLIQDGVMRALSIDDSMLSGTAAEKAPLQLGDDRPRVMAILEPSAIVDMRDWMADVGLV